MRSEHAAIRVQLVQHHEAQVFEQPLPARVVGQDARVQHVGVGQNQIRSGADGGARVGGSVAIVSENAQRVGQRAFGCGGVPAIARDRAGDIVVTVQFFRPPVQFRELILCQSLGREQIHRARLGILDERVQDRQVVAKRLARSCGRDDDQILAFACQAKRLGLMRVEPFDAARLKALGERGR